MWCPFGKLFTKCVTVVFVSWMLLRNSVTEVALCVFNTSDSIFISADLPISYSLWDITCRAALQAFCAALINLQKFNFCLQKLLVIQFFTFQIYVISYFCLWGIPSDKTLINTETA